MLASSLQCSCDGDEAIESRCGAVASDGSDVVGADLAGDPTMPEGASGYRTGLKPVIARRYMVVTSNAFASAAGCAVLRRGGTAADAAVAVQAVLGLTVPEATGLGAGGFILYYDSAANTVQAYDGRESAPAAATPNDLRVIDEASDPTPPLPDARASGRSIGTPGVPRLIEALQKDHGRLEWKDLFGDAIALAIEGFPIGGRLAAAIASNAGALKRDAQARAYFFEADGTPKALGTTLTNPAYANTLRLIAAGGADAFYTGSMAADIVATIATTKAANDGTPITPGKTTLADLADYRVKMRLPVCTTYRAYWVCGAPPPSSGGTTVAAALGILENFDLAALRPRAIDGQGGTPTVAGVHLVAEAERLAYADRDRYVADPDFVPLPGGDPQVLLNKPYLKRRAALIRPNASLGTALAGELTPLAMGIDRTIEHGTNHFTIVDREGNVVSATTTVESSMGSFHMTRGFLLNNQLTDFSTTPTDANGAPIANRLEAGKRPRSSMAPTLVFKTAADGGRGEFVLATGSPGGAAIPQYVVKTLIGVLDWGLDAQQSAALVDFGAFNHPLTMIGGEHPSIRRANDGADDPLVRGLRALGHRVWTGAQPSGVNTVIRVRANGAPAYAGGTDPRREGVVMGDTR